MDIATLGLRVDSDGAIRAVRQFGAEADRAAHQSSGLEASVKRVAAVFATYRAIQAARDTIALADSYTNLRARLGLVTTGTENLVHIQRELFSASQDTRTALEGNVALYASLARSTKSLHLTQQELVDVTRTVAQSFLISGASVSETNAAVRQLSQALASGVLRGDEFNSIAENAPRLQQAVADSLGVTIGQLRAMAAQGEITGQVITTALLKSRVAISDEYSKMPLTVGGSITQLRNALLVYVGAGDQATGASHTVAEAISLVARNLGTLVQIATVAGAVLVGRWVGGMLDANRATLTLADSVLRGNSVLLSSVDAQRGAAAAAVERAQVQRVASTQVVTALRAEQLQIEATKRAARDSFQTATTRLAQPRVADNGAPITLSGQRYFQERDQREVVVAMAARGAAQQTMNQVAQRSVAIEGELAGALAAHTAANNTALAAGVRRIAVLGATTIASRAAAVATRTLSGAMALLGGPIGVAILAATALNALLDNYVGKQEAAIAATEERESAEVRAVLAAKHAREQAKQEESDRSRKLREELGQRDIEVAKQRALNAAFGQSALSLALINNAYDARAEKAKNAIDHTAAETAALNARTDALRKAKDDAARQEAGQAARMAGAENADRVRSARQEYDLVGLTGKAAALLRNEQEAINAEIRARLTLRGDELDAQLRAIANERTWKDATAERVEQIRKAMEAGEPFGRAVKDMQRHLSGFLSDVVSKGVSSFGDLFTRIKDMFAQMIADMVAASFVKRIAAVVAGLLGNLIPQDAMGADGKPIARTGGQGMAMAGAGLAGLGIGFGVGQAVHSTSHDAAGNYARGALGGAAGGAAAGFMIAGPAGAAVGAVAGFVGGIIGVGKAAREAAKQMAEAQKALALSMAALRAEVNGDAVGAGIAQVNADREQRRKLIEDAFPGGGSGSEQVRKRNAALAEMNALEDRRIALLREQYAIAQRRDYEDLRVRDLASQGREAEAKALAKQLEQQREMEEYVKKGADPATLALLQQVQAQEKLKAATDAASSSALNMVQGYKLQAAVFTAMTGRASPTAVTYTPPTPAPKTTGTGGSSGSGDLTINVTMPDGSIIGKAVLKDFKAKADAQFGDESQWGRIQ